MRYYIISDVHAFYNEMIKTLTEAGYFEDKEPHKLIICGDLMDRGSQALEMQSFVIDLRAKDEVILIRGNHEDLMMDLIQGWKDLSYIQPHFRKNGTLSTFIQLTGATSEDILSRPKEVLEKLKKTPFVKQIIPSMKDYFETEHYIFVHGWIPSFFGRGWNDDGSDYYDEWRTASTEMWEESRWTNGMEAAYNGVTEKGKTIVCGHWATCFGHGRYEGVGDENISMASLLEPYYAKGIIAIDGCTAFSHKVNCIVVED